MSCGAPIVLSFVEKGRGVSTNSLLGGELSSG